MPVHRCAHATTHLEETVALIEDKGERIVGVTAVDGAMFIFTTVPQDRAGQGKQTRPAR